MYSETFPAKLKKAREVTGLTQREVAKETKISQVSIAQYETGTRQPNIETLGILADFYEISLDWLIGTKGNNQPSNASITKNINTASYELEKDEKKAI